MHSQVHARCYGELEPVDGVLWLCNLCLPGTPDSPPPCCLCPVIGMLILQGFGSYEEMGACITDFFLRWCYEAYN